jgi:transposase-like protein
MGRPKGKTNKSNKYWTKEEKLRIVKRVVSQEDSLSIISKEEKINPGQAHVWVKKYLELGEEGLINQKKPGTPYKGLNLKKKLTDLEQLQYENMKLRVENERLKKGYMVEGVGLGKRFIDISNKNMK